MSSSNPNIVDLMRRLIRAELSNYHTTIPGRIVTVDGTNRRVEVLPLLRFPRYDEDDNKIFLDPPTIPGVPIAIPASANSKETIYISEGDTVLLFISMYALDELLSEDPAEGPFEPQDERQQALQDAFAMPVSWSVTDTPEELDADRTITSTADGEIKIGVAANAQSLAFQQSSQTAFNDLVAAINSALASKKDATGTAGTIVAPTVNGTTNLKAS